MLRTQFISFIRSFKKDKFYILANVISLAIAFSLSTIAYFNYQYNNEYNHYFKNAEHLFKINQERETQRAIGSTPAPLAEYINQQIINGKSSRYNSEHLVIKKEVDFFQQKVAFVDPQFLTSFEFPTTKGQPAKINNKNEAIITDKLAMALFNSLNVIGKTITILNDEQKEFQFSIGQVLAHYPKNISFNFDLIVPFDNYFDIYGQRKQEWTHWIDGTFIELDGNTQVKDIQNSIQQYLTIQNDKNAQEPILRYSLSPIKDWPAFEARLYKSAFSHHLPPSSVLGTVCSALGILLLACFNFVNTSIAISAKRLKEMAMRKVMGSSRSQIIKQLLLEHFILIVLALFMSLGISSLLIPNYNALFNFEIVQFKFISVGYLILIGLAFVLFVGLAAGLYPAIHISRYSALAILKRTTIINGKNGLTKTLLTIQFTLCLYNIFCLLVFVENGQFQKTLDRGYDILSTINVKLSEPEQFDILKATLSKHPDFETISASKNLIGFHCEDIQINEDGFTINALSISTGATYASSIGLTLLSGSFFQENSENHQEILINELLEKSMGRPLLNQKIIVDNQKYLVRGIVKDFNQKSIMLDNKIRPVVIKLAKKKEFKYAAIHIASNKRYKLNQELRAIWYQLFPNELYQSILQEKAVESSKQTNRIIISINSFIAIVSVLISALGLYSLIALRAQKRMKEFGIRKVLGASRSHIGKLLSKEILIILVVSIIVASVVGHFILSMLLDVIFAYHILLHWTHFIWPVVILFLIVITAVGYKIFETARANPVSQLRSE